MAAEIQDGIPTDDVSDDAVDNEGRNLFLIKNFGIVL